jgi:hypothetical protein
MDAAATAAVERRGVRERNCGRGGRVVPGTKDAKL